MCTYIYLQFTAVYIDNWTGLWPFKIDRSKNFTHPQSPVLLFYFPSLVRLDLPQGSSGMWENAGLKKIKF